ARTETADVDGDDRVLLVVSGTCVPNVCCGDGEDSGEKDHVFFEVSHELGTRNGLLVGFGEPIAALPVLARELAAGLPVLDRGLPALGAEAPSLGVAPRVDVPDARDPEQPAGVPDQQDVSDIDPPAIRHEAVVAVAGTEIVAVPQVPAVGTGIPVRLHDPRPR